MDGWQSKVIIIAHAEHGELKKNKQKNTHTHNEHNETFD